MIRKLLRWLASAELDLEYNRGYADGLSASANNVRMAEQCDEVRATLAHQRGRLEGYSEGRTEAFNAVADCMLERGGTEANEQDLAMARKKGIH